MKTRGEITVKEIEDSPGANRNTIKVHLKKLAEQHYLAQMGKGRGARYVIKSRLVSGIHPLAKATHMRMTMRYGSSLLNWKRPTALLRNFHRQRFDLATVGH